MKVIGIDLAAKEHRQSGVAVLEDGKLVKRLILHTDKEIVDFVKKENPKVVAIDAPLTKVRKGYRKAEKELIKVGIRPLPLGMPAMQLLSERALRLKNKIKLLGTEVIETFPRGVGKVIGKIDEKNEHIRDAIYAAIAAYCYLKNYYNAYGNDEKIILPKRGLKFSRDRGYIWIKF